MTGVPAAATAVLAALVLAAPAGARAPEPDQGRQWSLAAMNAPDAWAKSEGKGVVVAVVDAGIDPHSSELRGRILRGAILVDTRRSMSDDGLGTYYASLIAAGRNGRGMAGVAPRATILPIKITELGNNTPYATYVLGGGTAEENAAGIEAAVRGGAQVIALTGAPSWLYEALDTAFEPVASASYLPLTHAIQRATRRGVAVVAPAGDLRRAGCPPYLPVHRLVVCVGATEKRGALAPYSSTVGAGTHRFVVAPGGTGAGTYVDDYAFGPSDLHLLAGQTDDDVLGVASPNEYDYDGDGLMSSAGTIVAAAHVAGVLALGIGRGLSPAQAVDRLVATATDLGPPGPDALYGAGLVNAARMVG